MKLPHALLYALIIAMVFALLIKLEPLLGTSGTVDSDSIVKAFHLSERMRLEANLDFQLQESFNRFRDELFADCAKVFERRVEPDYLKDNLPPHTLAVALVGEDTELLKYANLNGSCDIELARQFIKFDFLQSTVQEDVFFGTRYADELRKADALLASFLGLKADRIALMQLRASKLSVFSSPEKSIALYWDKQTIDSGHKIYLFSRIDLSAADPYFPFKSLLDKINLPDTVCAYYDVERRNFLAGHGFKKFMQTQAFKPLAKACFDLEGAGKPTASHVNIDIIKAGSVQAILGRRIFTFPLVPVVAIDSAASSDGARVSAGVNMYGFAFAALLFVMFIQTFAFGRGVKLSVGRALILASLLAIFMPFMMGRSIFKLILSEASNNERLKLEREMHNLITSQDSAVRLFHANFFHNLKELLSSEEVVQRLLNEEKKDNMTVAADSLADIDNAVRHDIVAELAERAFDPFVEGLGLARDVLRKANAIIVIGPNGFLRYFDRFKNKIYSTLSLPEADSMYVVLNLYKLATEQFFDKNEFVPGLLGASKSGQAREMEKLVHEEVKSQVKASVGAEKLYEMFANFEGVNIFRTTIGMVNFGVFPVRIQGLIKYFCGVAWDELAISRVYLKRSFTSYNLSGQSSDIHSQKSIFARLDPVNFFPKPLTFIQAYGALRSDMVYSGEAESPKLGGMIKSTYRSRKMIKIKSEGEDDALYQVIPGRFFSLYILGGRQETSYLKQIEKWRFIIFMTGLLVFAVFAAFSAINISRSVSSPLEHLLWGIGMIEKCDYSVKLRESREDEFGSISRAFNKMVRRLRERDTLGKFVSQSVRKLASNPDLLKKAQEGTETEVTILFADLEGFTKFAANAEGCEVQQKLEFSLGHFFNMASRFGGEVDKVIGEKLLIIFSHEDGHRKAAESAVALARGVMLAFEHDKVVKPVFGLNSGRVISGIIGAAAVRMDNTVIGDPVNVAARLCSLARSESMPLIVSGEIIEALGADYSASRLEVSKIRGKKQEVEVFNLLG